MIEQLISKLARHLDKNKVPYMVIGGQAVLKYGTPRLTQDIDITLGIDTDRFSLVRAACREIGLAMLPKNPLAFAKDTKVLPTKEKRSGIRVDFIFSYTPYEMGALKRVRKVSMSGYPVKFASPEDVIIHKMIAGRAIDCEDVKNIITKNKRELDLPYVRKWLKKFESVPGQEGVSKRFESVVAGA